MALPPPSPTISTIIPTYRRPHQLRRAILSVLAQSYPHFQVCVYDNNSGDETEAVVGELARNDPRVLYVRHPSNIGAYANFQSGLDQLNTPLFSFLSDDDTLLPNFFETALAGFKQFPDAAFSVTDVVHVNKEGNIVRTALESWSSGYYAPPDGLIAILTNGHSEWTGILFRKSVIGTVGTLDFESGKFGDLDFTLRAAARCPFVVTKTPCAIFDLSTSQSRSPFPFDETWSGFQKMVANITGDQTLSPDVRNRAERTLVGAFESQMLASGLTYLSRGDPVDARKVADALLARFGGAVRYATLRALIAVHQRFPVARFAFGSLVDCRRRRLARQVQHNQRRHHGLALLLPPK